MLPLPRLLSLALALGFAGCGERPEKESAAAPSGTAEPTQAAPDGVQEPLEETLEEVAPAAVGEAAGARDFDVESAKITFEYSGLEEGTVTVWLDGYGETIAMLKDMQKPMPSKTHTLWKAKQTTMWDDAGKQKPYVTKIRPKETELRLISTRDPTRLETAGYTKQANETVAGQDCEVWHSEAQNVTLWRWKGIDLKYHNGSLGKLTQSVEATQVVVPASLPAEALPPG